MVGCAEAALEAWADCKPDGMTLSEELVPALLPTIAVRVPGGLDSPDQARRLHEIFNSKTLNGEEPPEFLKMLHPINGQVHFLYFWQAFSQAAHLVAAVVPAPSRSVNMGIQEELERLRDSILVQLQATALRAPTSYSSGSSSEAPRQAPMEAAGRCLANAQLIELVHGVASKSSWPSFWQEVMQTVHAYEKGGSLGLEELAVVLLSWLHDASAWAGMNKVEETSPSSETTLSGTSTAASSTGRKRREAPKEVGLPVFLHIYDVSQDESVQKLNRILAHRYSPLKLGGVFHAGVEVNSLEWSYGYSMSETVPGISCVEPRTHPAHHYRQTVRLPRTKLTGEEIMLIMGQLLEEYPGDDYDLLRRNCCHFADDFCQRLGVGPIPGWVHRLARIGARLEGFMQVAQGSIEKLRGVLMSEPQDVHEEEEEEGDQQKWVLERR